MTVSVRQIDLAVVLQIIDEVVDDLSDDEWEAVGRLRAASVEDHHTHRPGVPTHAPADVRTYCLDCGEILEET